MAPQRRARLRRTRHGDEPGTGYRPGRCTRLAGWLAVVTGGLHTVVAAYDHREVGSALLAEGLWDTVSPGPVTPADVRRSEAFWVTVGSCGVPVLVLGCWVLSADRHGDRVPVWSGWVVLGWGSVLAAGLPRSPSWAVPLVGALIVAGHRRGRAAGAAGGPARSRSTVDGTRSRGR